MSDFKRYFTLTCISFTFLVLLYSFLAHIQYFSQPTVTTNFQLFAISSSIEFLMFFTDKLNFKNRISEILVDLLDNVIVVFVLGAILKMFSFSISNILIISFMIIVIYFGVYGISIIKGKADAGCINKRIKALKEESKKEQETNE